MVNGRHASWFLGVMLCAGCGGAESSAPPGSGGNADPQGSSSSSSAGSGGEQPHAMLAEDDPFFGDETRPAFEFERCNELTIEFEGVTPTIFILVDRSTSMESLIGQTQQSRWDALREALIGAGGVVEQFQSDVRFGFMAFTSPKGTGGVCDAEDSGGIVNREIISPDVQRYSDIVGVYSTMEPGLAETPGVPTDTPTVIAYRRAVQLLLEDPFVGSKHILLVSDGQPDQCNDGDPCIPQDEMIGEVQAAYEQGVGTFAMTVATEPALQNHITDVANAGQGLPIDDICIHVMPKHGTYAAAGAGTTENLSYNSESQEAIASGLAQIIGGVRTCSFLLNHELEGNVGTGQVRLQMGPDEYGEPLVYGDPNGWQLQGNNTVELLGTACEQLKDKSVVLGVDIGFPCEVILF